MTKYEFIKTRVFNNCYPVIENSLYHQMINTTKANKACSYLDKLIVDNIDGNSYISEMNIYELNDLIVKLNKKFFKKFTSIQLS